MHEKVRRLNPTTHALRHLYALSQNRCAFPGCPSHVFDDEGNLLAEVCHIEAANETGQRFNPAQSNEERRQIENLVILCRNHHVVTDDVVTYTTNVMKDVKVNHEAKAHGNPQADTLLQERFVDLSLSASLQMPENFRQLDLAYIEEPFFVESRRLIEAIAKVPSLSRSLYAHAVANSYIGDLYIFCDPNELSQRLGVPLWELQAHFELLQNHGLLWVPEYKNDWLNPPGSGLRSYFRQPDREDYGIYFLCLIRKRFDGRRPTIVDIFENLNFGLLDA